VRKKTSFNLIVKRENRYK